jgi:nucleoid-associated protein YgaU
VNALTKGGVGAVLGTGLGAALSALGKASDSSNGKKEAKDKTDRGAPAVSPTPTEKPKPATDSTSASASVQGLAPTDDLHPTPSPSKPVEVNATTNAGPNPSHDSSPAPALPPVSSPPPGVLPNLHPVGEASPAQDHEAKPKSGSITSTVPEATAGTIIGEVHPNTESVHAPASASSNTARSQAQVQDQGQQPGAQVMPPESARPLDQTSTPAIKPEYQELARLGWAPLKRTGAGVVRDVQREGPGGGDEAGNSDGSDGNGNRADVTTDPSAHADKEQSFEVESPPSRGRAARGDGLSGDTAAASAGPTPRGDEKMDTVLHKVEYGENFWTIARLYYPSGRYYRALWKYNSGKVKEIDKLYVNTVIKIPPPEDLDPAYIDPPGTRAPRTGTKNLNLARQDGEAAVPPPGRGDGVPVRRSSRSDAELNLPISDPSTEQASDRGSSSRASGRSSNTSRAIDDEDFPDRNNKSDAEPEIRPRTTITRPVYKVRPYDTLRTIARDTMGDSRRADEVLDLNRDIIDDPGHLIVGQVLELPEDARAVRARSRR